MLAPPPAAPASRRAATPVPIITRPLDAIVAWHGGRAMTVSDLLADAGLMARQLPAHAYLINVCTSRYGFLVAFVASLQSRRICLLPGSNVARRQLETILADFPDSLVVTDTPLPETTAAGLATMMVPILAGSAPSDELALAPAPDSIACIAFTSGSTGQPVPHAKAWGSLMAQTEAATRRFGLAGADSTAIVATVPQGHMYGFETTILLALRANVAVLSETPLYPDDVRQALAEVPAPRLLVTSPVHLRALTHGRQALPALRTVISATAPLAAALANKVERRFATEVLEIYGCTEAGSLASRRTTADEAWLPYDCVDVLAANRDGSGLVEVRVPHMVRPVALNDLLELLAGGRFLLKGRREDMIKVGGMRGSLTGLSAILLAIDGVLDGVFVMPDDAKGDDAARPTVIVAAPGMSPKEILGELRRRIDPAFIPRRIIMTAALPRDALGKLPKARLAELMASGGDGAAGGPDGGKA